MVTLPRASAVLAALALVAMAGLTPAAPAVPPPPTTPFRVGLIGDSGYNAEYERYFLRIRESANAAGLAFVVHDGDIRMGGTHPIPQRRQADVPENARWERGGVVFATLNVPGPRGGGPTLSADLAWLDKTFDRAEAIRAPGVMIIWQDDPTDGSSPGLVAKLKKRAAAFRKPVMLVHGDTHRYRLDNPWKEVRNLTRLETYPTFTPERVKVIVNPAGPAVFTVARVRA